MADQQRVSLQYREESLIQKNRQEREDEIGRKIEKGRQGETGREGERGK